MAGLAWVNGVTSSLEEAKVSFLDRGYLFGDGVYEAIKVYNGYVFALDEHLERLEKSMKAIRIEPSWSREELVSIIRDLVAESGIEDTAMVYMQVTRAVGPRQHAFPKEGKPTLAIFVSPLPSVPQSVRDRGVKAITVPDERWAHPHIKTLNLLPNVLAKQEAEEKGAYEAIFVREGDLVSEGSSSNVFAVINGTLVTPPTDGRILAGITRAVVLELARKANYEVKEDYLKLEELRQADEIFITNTSAEVLAIVELDGKPVGDGWPGSMTKELYRLFMERVQENV